MVVNMGFEIQIQCMAAGKGGGDVMMVSWRSGGCVAGKRRRVAGK
jgi:hypothetical protein